MMNRRCAAKLWPERVLGRGSGRLDHDRQAPLGGLARELLYTIVFDRGLVERVRVASPACSTPSIAELPTLDRAWSSPGYRNAVPGTRRVPSSLWRSPPKSRTRLRGCPGRKACVIDCPRMRLFDRTHSPSCPIDGSSGPGLDGGSSDASGALPGLTDR